MSEDTAKEDKTEAPSIKKLQDALDKGNAPISREIPLFASLLAFLSYLTLFLPSEISKFAQNLYDFLEKIDQWNLEKGSDTLSLFFNLGRHAVELIFPGLLLLMIFGIGSYVFQKLPPPTFERLKPDFKRISIREGWKRIHKFNNLVDFTKVFLKIFVIGTCITFLLQENFFQISNLISYDLYWLLSEIFIVTRKVLIIILLSMTILAAADLGWTHYNWHSNLRMTKQEIKEEIKQSQGDPLIKSRQRSIARNRARHRMIKAVSKATLIITNPTHYALALRYKREENDAPKGRNLIALKIREIAEQDNIPIFEEPTLARSLFKQVPINKTIPPVFYKAVAQLIHKIYSDELKKKIVTTSEELLSEHELYRNNVINFLTYSSFYKGEKHFNVASR